MGKRWPGIRGTQVDACARGGYLYPYQARTPCHESLNRDDTMQFRRSTRALILVAAASMAGTACKPKETPTVTLKGDSVINVARMTFANGVTSAECVFTVNATAAGPEGSSATLTQGRVVYLLKQTGDTMMKRPIEAAAIPDFFDGKATISVGTPITSKRQGLSVSQPTQPIQGYVTFDYTAEGAKEPKTTAPYVFVCQ